MKDDSFLFDALMVILAGLLCSILLVPFMAMSLVAGGY